MLASLLLSRLAAADTVSLAWDFPLLRQPGTQYVMRATTMLNGAPFRTEQTVDVLPVATCQGWPDSAFTPDTLCAEVCFNPGVYSATLVAWQGNDRSKDSNVLDLDLTATQPCKAVPLVPPVKPPTPQPPTQPPDTGGGSGGGIAGGIVIGGAAAGILAFQSHPPPLPALVNRQCVDWKIVGPCFCSPFNPCLQVEYWEPAWIVETVKVPGDSVLGVLGKILAPALAAVGIPPLGGGGAGNASGTGHTNLQYTEAHVYAFPQVLGGPCTSCAPTDAVPVLHYASEIDPVWRTAVATPSPLDLVRQVGVWGPLYPRGGKAIHGSEPVGAALAAFRAMSIAAMPIGEPPHAEAHVVIQPTAGLGTCMQLAWPKQTPCLPAGTPPPVWETGALSLRGKYLFIIHRKRSCCVNPNATTCGLTLPGVGGHGQNLCLLP